MKRNTIRITESQLHQVIKESVKRTLNEINEKEEKLDEFKEAIDLLKQSKKKIQGYIGQDALIPSDVLEEEDKEKIKNLYQQLEYALDCAGYDGYCNLQYINQRDGDENEGYSPADDNWRMDMELGYY